MKKYILISIIFSAITATLSLSSCSKNEENSEERYTSATGQFITLKISDAQGNDLLDNTQSGSYTIDDIQYTYYFDGKKKTVNDPTLTYSKNIQIVKNADNTYEVKVFLLTPLIGKNNETIYLQFAGNEPDEIKAQYTINKANEKESGYGPTNGCSLDKVWVNGELVDTTSGEPIVLKKQAKK